MIIVKKHRISFIPYMGGKFYALDVLYAHMPKNINEIFTICEPFGGGGSFILNLPKHVRKKRIIVYNDLNGSLSALFYVLTHPTLFERFIKHMRYVILSDIIFQKYLAFAINWQQWIHEDPQAYFNDDEFVLTLAIASYVALRSSYSGFMKEKSSFRRQTLARQDDLEKLKDESNRVNHRKFYPNKIKGLLKSFIKINTGIDNDEVKDIMKEVNKKSNHEITEEMITSVLERVRERIQDDGVIVECADYRKIFRRYDNNHAFFFLDPPYESIKGLYQLGFTREDHEQLLDEVKNLQGYFLMTLDASPWVVENYEKEGLNVMPIKKGWRYCIDHISSSGREVLITNYDDFIGNKVLKKEIVMRDLDGYLHVKK